MAYSFGKSTIATPIKGGRKTSIKGRNSSNHLNKHDSMYEWYKGSEILFWYPPNTIYSEHDAFTESEFKEELYPKWRSFDRERGYNFILNGT